MKIYQGADITIVPTTKDFIEGFNKTLAESILAGKPAITSSVCPALSVLEKAVIEVSPEDTRAYTDAILKLRSDKELYEQKCKACLKLQEQFYDESNSWGTKFMQVLVNYMLGSP